MNGWCGVKRCWCSDESERDMAALVHTRTVITRWLRNDLGFGVDGHALAERAEGKFAELCGGAPWRQNENDE